MREATLDDHEDTAAAAARVLQQFRIVFTAVKTHFQQVERAVGIGGAQIWALAVIRDRPGIGVSELAAALNVRQPTASNLVKNLAQQGYVEVRRDSADRRAVQVHTTAEGRKLLRRSPGAASGVLPEALSALDLKSLTQLERHLETLIGHLGADRSAGKIPLAEI